MHYSERIAHLQAICMSSPPEDWRPTIAGYLLTMRQEEIDVLVACLRRQVKREVRLLAAKKAALTILTGPQRIN